MVGGPAPPPGQTLVEPGHGHNLHITLSLCRIGPRIENIWNSFHLALLVLIPLCVLKVAVLPGATKGKKESERNLEATVRRVMPMEGAKNCSG